jgi:glycopeptide antibiotics resistance protein
LIIELAQAAALPGLAATDDFLLNTLGAVLGYAVGTLIVSLASWRRRHRLGDTARLTR